VPSIEKLKFFSLLFISVSFFNAGILGQPSTVTIEWGTHGGDDNDAAVASPIPWAPDATMPSSIQKLYGLNDTGATVSQLKDTSSGDSDDGDLIEIGFFNKNTAAWTNPVADSDFDPNTDTSNLFQGVWTPLTSTTTIGRDWSARTVGAGEFFFNTNFQGSNDYSTTNASSNPLGNDDLDDSMDELTEMREALDAASSPLLGIRFYDIDTADSGGTTKSSGASKYNTIMNPNWVYTGGDLKLYLHQQDGTLDSNLKFEFDVGDYNGVSKVGNANTAVNAGSATHNEFVTAITYYDGESGLTASNASHVLSGLDGYGTIAIGSDRTLTLHANSGVDRSFIGDIETTGGGSGATTLVKTGTGKQILSGDLRITDDGSGTSSGWLNINEGTLSLAGSGKTYTIEYLTGAGGTLELNTTDVIELGFANTTASQSFDGNISLVGTGDRTIKIASGTDADDYKLEQNVSGTISGSNKLIKTGVGRMVLEADNSNSGGVDIEDGTLVIGNSANDADAGSGTITINKGKLEVLSGDTLGNTIAGGSGKSMIGGDGTFTSVTVGSGGGEVDTISPGSGHSTSTSSGSSTQQVNRNTSLDDAIGSLTIANLDLNHGGVFDWEIGDFSGSTAGSDWDLLTVDNFDFSGTFTVNILPLDTNGDMGSSAGGMWTNKTGTNGFKFLDVGTWVSTAPSTGTVTSGFDINSSAWLYHKNDPYGDWSVYYDAGTTAFYLQYSAVPEPSTYIMVTGLLMVPGMSYVRRFRKKKAGAVMEDTPNSV